MCFVPSCSIGFLVRLARAQGLSSNPLKDRRDNVRMIVPILRQTKTANRLLRQAKVANGLLHASKITSPLGLQEIPSMILAFRVDVFSPLIVVL